MTAYEIRARQRALSVKERRHKIAGDIMREFQDRLESRGAFRLVLWAVSHLGIDDTVDIIARHIDQYSIYHAINAAWRNKCRTYQGQK